ncbi:MAG: hypothetical protein A2941_02015 [Candidatus Yanofskybacteria bacterium RIFCSPLOWO2_01_FULL_49_17]|uniref:HTH psq-type domain-containing protein n=1 Tax=Candidatus Yanofskybacteria bacterium RIFCSPLOWO2_01_FULL_49_17 TaxID=1802700 RepID=A0A1F8GUG8_9BACT|nr:MAG: hypothetical protein A2941_02015 [Candidatus Yanofskybacteria bacterium RIFCSPLOWO2_01_FULL_49_17]
MRKDKIRAYELRRQEKSYSEISQVLNIPKSTLTSWFKKEEWSKTIRDKLGKEQSFSWPKKLAAIQKANKARWGKLHETYRNAGEKEFESLKNNPLFIAGLMLYWGEGNNSPKYSQVKLANSDPTMIRVFYNFLKEALSIQKERIFVWLLLYPDLNDEMQKRFWNKATGIPVSQFKNSIFIKGRHPTKRLSYGVCNIYINSREIKEKVLLWINLYQKLLAR